MRMMRIPKPWVPAQRRSAEPWPEQGVGNLTKRRTPPGGPCPSSDCGVAGMHNVFRAVSQETRAPTVPLVGRYPHAMHSPATCKPALVGLQNLALEIAKQGRAAKDR
jgi:hypothetical protein